MTTQPGSAADSWNAAPTDGGTKVTLRHTDVADQWEGAPLGGPMEPVGSLHPLPAPSRSIAVRNHIPTSATGPTDSLVGTRAIIHAIQPPPLHERERREGN